MSDLLAIVDEQELDEEQLVAEILRRHPTRVTLLLEHGPPVAGAERPADRRVVRDRLVKLLAAIEQRTGAVVVGLADSREQLKGWRFDRIVAPRRTLAAPAP